MAGGLLLGPICGNLWPKVCPPEGSEIGPCLYLFQSNGRAFWSHNLAQVLAPRTCPRFAFRLFSGAGLRSQKRDLRGTIGLCLVVSGNAWFLWPCFSAPDGALEMVASMNYCQPVLLHLGTCATSAFAGRFWGLRRLFVDS